ncbi:MAG: hypothetical protein AAF841_07350 [Pseudomonadota bacterium]
MERLRRWAAYLRRDERGSAAEWTLLCAALVSMAIVASSMFADGSSEHAERIDGCLSSMSEKAEIDDDAVMRAQEMAQACNDGAAAS